MWSTFYVEKVCGRYRLYSPQCFLVCVRWALRRKIMGGKMDIALLHHVSVPVTDVSIAKQFYSEILGLQEIARPPFDFEGVWFRVGDGQHLHLIKHSGATFRKGGIDSRDVHFAVRVASYSKAVAFLRSKGYSDSTASGDLKAMKVSRTPVAGFPQIYILDPDRNVIEINAEMLDDNG
jgi:catechol 2,3-dioxygenase-like lactoylglutathione lyase family enzyme